MVELRHGLIVVADDVVRIEVDPGRAGVHVQLRSSPERVWVDCDYGRSAYDTVDRLRQVVEGAE